jgi:monofunctional biosynthetic peptidoglycan transglycosylase
MKGSLAGGAASGRRPGRRWKIVAAILGFMAASATFVWFVVVPWPRGLGSGQPDRTALMRQRAEAAGVEGDSLEIRWSWVPLEEISPNLIRAVIVAEDYRFREHAGVDWVSLSDEVHWTGDGHFSWTSLEDLAALREAVAYVWDHRDEIRGRSTLTQQLAKNLYFGTDRSFVRKAQELLVAQRLERSLGKDRILELYLNVVEWGPGLFGAEAAAQRYFDHPASSLTMEEAAALAGTLPHPLTSNPAYRPGRMAWRQELILERLNPKAGRPLDPIPLPDPTIPLPAPARSIEFAEPVLVAPRPVGRADPAGSTSTVAVGDTADAADTVTVEDTAAVADTGTVGTGSSGATPDTVHAPGYMLMR